MTASYDPTLDTTLDQVRFMIGDTDVATNAQLQDEEIAYELLISGDVVRSAAVALCRRLQAKYAVLTDTSEGDVSKKWSQLFDHFGQLAETLGNVSSDGSVVATPYAGGISVADVDTRTLNTDRVPTAFGHRHGSVAWPYGSYDRWRSGQ